MEDGFPAGKEGKKMELRMVEEVSRFPAAEPQWSVYGRSGRGLLLFRGQEQFLRAGHTLASAAGSRQPANVSFS